MPKHLEKLDSNEPVQKNTLEQLEDLFRVIVGHETTIENIRKSFVANKFRKATIIITGDFDIYVSDRLHYEIVDKNGLQNIPVVDSEIGLSGSIRSTEINDRALARIFLEGMRSKTLSLMDRETAITIIKRAVQHKIDLFLRENIDLYHK